MVQVHQIEKRCFNRNIKRANLGIELNIDILKTIDFFVTVSGKNGNYVKKFYGGNVEK